MNWDIKKHEEKKANPESAKHSYHTMWLKTRRKNEFVVFVWSCLFLYVIIINSEKEREKSIHVGNTKTCSTKWMWRAEGRRKERHHQRAHETASLDFVVALIYWFISFGIFSYALRFVCYKYIDTCTSVSSQQCLERTRPYAIDVYLDRE